ncbi:MAG: alpha/beta fold hydrolase [Paenisporosarcina sp.]
MKLHTAVFGDGEPIVFLHTGLQTGLTDFEYQREYFKGSFKVILPDLRGHGQSSEDDFSNYFEDCAKDLAETLKELGMESAHIVGCSLGALVGLVFAKRFSEMVKSVTLSGITAEKPDDWLKTHSEDVAMQTQLLQNEDIINFFDNQHQSDWRQFLYMARNEDWYPFDETNNLNGIHAPILFMVGEGNSNETKGAIVYPKMKDNVHVAIIPFAGHLVHTEQPLIYTKILEEFLNKVR